jgi:hypothetical protein
MANASVGGMEMAWALLWLLVVTAWDIPSVQATALA